MSETTGQKPTDKNCRMCGVELLTGKNFTKTNLDHGMYFCQGCVPKELKNRRMFVNGKYIPKTHPLHKPGKYKGFMDAAFSSLENYERSVEGEVYIIYNPSFPGWVKVGMAIDSKDRLKQYQTGSPYRNYTLVASYTVENRREAESKVHLLLEDKHSRRGEWFYCTAPVAKDILNKYFNSTGEQLELF